MSETIARETADQAARLERLIAMGTRLAEAITADIKALEAGALQSLKTADPEIARLAALYAREISALKAEGGIKSAPRETTLALKDVGTRLKESLVRHERLVAAMREASEGLVLAVAEEVEKKRKGGAPYSVKPEKPRTSGGAMLYNNLI